MKKFISHALIAVALTAATAATAKAQQGGERTHTALRIVIIASRVEMRPSKTMTPTWQFSLDKLDRGSDETHKVDRRNDSINSKPVKLEPVRIVAPRDNQLSRGK